MARYKRKKHLYSAAVGKGTQRQSKDPTSTDFNSRQKKLIREYLDRYRREAKMFHDGESILSAPQEEKEEANSNETCVAEISLPKLTPEILEQKYLSLPADLSFRQRQFIHACCIDLRLYHIGLGVHGTSERYISISIFCDAFDDIADEFRPKYLGFHKKFKPWFCRHNNYLFRDETTKSFRAKIQALIDQPGSCLRDDVDVVNYAELEGQDITEVALINDIESTDASGWMLVDTAEKMKQCIQELIEGQPTELAFDVEAYNPSEFCQQTCLLQLASNLGKEYVIDTLAEGVWDKVEGLAPLFANPRVVKVGHSIGGLDARCLHRDFGIFLCNVFDTYEAARVLNLPSHGLAAVCEYYGMDATEYYKLKEVYQTTDWRRRPLTDEMILYGRYDVRYLLHLRKLMMRDLTYSELFTGGDDEGQLVAESLAATLQRIHDFEDGVEFETASEGNDAKDTDDELGDDRGGGTIGELFLDAEDVIDESHDLVKTSKIAPAHVLRMQPRLMRVISESQDRCMDLWTSKTEPHYRNALFASYMEPPKSIHGQHRPQLTQSQINLYEDLVRLRNNLAQKEECLPGFLCSLDDLARITIARPTSPGALRIISFFLPERLESRMNQVFVLTSQSLRTDGLRQGPLDVAARRYHKHAKSNRILGFLGKAALTSIAVGALYFFYATRGRKLRR